MTDSRIDVRVTDDYMIDGLAIYISQKTGGTSRLLLHLHDDGAQSWDDVDSVAIVEPTLKLQGEFARALLDALLRHYQGASDMHTVRADLLHERGRVDKLTSGLLQIAIHASGSQWAGSTSPPADRFKP